jgi:hypothetical protein
MDGVNIDKEGNITVTNEWTSAVYIQQGNYTIKYQHLKEISVKLQQVIDDPEIVLGKIGPSQQHVHIEVRSSTKLHNPLLYFNPDLHNSLLARIDGVGNEAGETFYQNTARTIPWQTPITQPTITQQPGYLILQKFYGINPVTPTPSPAP